MPPWALRLLAVVVTGLSMIGSTTYTLAHPKNPNAPLQPPVEKSPDATPAAPTPTPIPSLVGTRRGNPPRGTSSPAPRLTLQPGVQATDLPEVTFTHVS